MFIKFDVGLFMFIIQEMHSTQDNVTKLNSLINVDMKHNNTAKRLNIYINFHQFGSLNGGRHSAVDC